MYKVEMVNTVEQFLEHTQIISLLKDQMDYIGSPKTNEQLLKTIKLAFKNENTHLMALDDNGHIVGFCFFNVCIGMESAGKYIWLNEMHIHKHYRSKGYGAILFTELQKWALENDVVRLMGMMDESEKRTINFYKKMDSEIYSQQIFSLKLNK